MPPRRTYSEVRSVFSAQGYVLLDKTYKNNKQLLRYICPKHSEYEQSIRFNDISTGHGCKYCGEERKFTNLREMAKSQRTPFNEVVKSFEERGYILLEDSYKSAHKLLKYRCSKHPDKTLTIRYSDLKDGGGCRYCAIEKGKLKLDEVKRRFEESGYTLLETEYINSRIPMRYICPIHPEKETKITLSSLTGGHGCTYCAIDNSKGKLSVHYNHDLPDDIRTKDRRYDAEIHAWRKAVYERGGYSCNVCGDDRGGNLNAHHKDGFNWCVDRRHDVSNGVTLCESCHKEFHSAFGYGDNTEKQFEDWKAIRKGGYRDDY